MRVWGRGQYREPGTAPLRLEDVRTDGVSDLVLDDRRIVRYLAHPPRKPANRAGDGTGSSWGRCGRAGAQAATSELGETAAVMRRELEAAMPLVELQALIGSGP